MNAQTNAYGFTGASPVPRCADAAMQAGFAEAWRNCVAVAIDKIAIIAATDKAGNIIFVNDRFCELSGYSRDELIGQNHRILNSGEHAAEFFRDMYDTIGAGQVWRAEIKNRAKDGSFYWVDTCVFPFGDEHVDGYLSVRFDITRQKNANDQLWCLANLDSLTGLPNRAAFTRALNNEMECSHAPFAVSIIDLDDFKIINDLHGHSVGDEYLVEFAHRLHEWAEAGDTVARLGGDEFAIIMKCRRPGDIERKLAALNDAIALDFSHESAQISYSLSIGLCMSNSNGLVDASDALKKADIALYAAKSAGRNCVRYFNDSMNEQIEKQFVVHKGVKAGIRNREFAIYYQPIVPLGSGQPLLIEALLRWRHPTQGLIYPNEFQEALNDGGLAHLLDSFVLSEVVKDIGAWKRQGIETPCVGLNAVASDFKDSKYADVIEPYIRNGELTPADIYIEVSESVVLGRSSQRIISEIRRLHNLGIRIAFDDFGVGFASLSNIRDIGADIIKIDKTFTNIEAHGFANRAIIEGVVALCKRLGKKVVAEGVETREQAEFLRSLGCDYIQGYFLCKPVDFATMTGKLLDRFEGYGAILDFDA